MQMGQYREVSFIDADDKMDDDINNKEIAIEKMEQRQ